MPIVMFTGNVTASAIGKNNPGLAFGADIFIAAGTAIYEALAAKIAKINLFEGSEVTNELSIANAEPLISGISNAKINGNHPKEKKAFNFLPLVTPMSSKNIAKKPLNRSFVKGLIPSACLALATNPMIKLPNINKTDPLVRECFTNAVLFNCCCSSLL